MMRSRWLERPQLGARELAAWSELAAHAVEPNPFFEPPFLLPALAHLPHRRVSLLAITDDDGWIAFMPVHFGLSWRRLPVPVRDPWRHSYAYLGTPLVARGREREAVRGLLTALQPRAGLVALEFLDEQGPVSTALTAAFREFGLTPIVWGRHERAALIRRPDNDYVATTLKSRRRRELRRQRAKLAEVLGAELTTVDRAGDPDAVEGFLELEASGWKGRAGTALSAAQAGSFFRGACQEFAREGRLQLLSMEAGGRRVAMKCNIVSGGVVSCLKIAHDETLATYSPGVQLEIDNIDVFHDRSDLAVMDSCAGYDNEMINRLWPDRRQLVTRLLARDGLMGTAVRNEAEMAATIRRRMKERNNAQAAA